MPQPAAPAPATPAAPATLRRVSHELVARSLTVHRVEDLTPSLRRVVLGGPDLAGFDAPGPADHVKVFFPHDPHGEPRLPVVDGGRWVNHDDPALLYRDYTVRGHVEPGALVIDMVLHPHGPAGRWAAGARPGQRLGVLGPRGSALPPLDRAWYLLAADETGLPALANWLDLLPASTTAHAFVEVGGPGDEIDLRSDARTEVTWLYRRDAPAGTVTLLADAVATLTLPTGPGWAWAGAEAATVRAIRRTLRDERGMDRDSVQMTGYWRVGEANFDHHSPDA
ncbi:siderophore-interacting protein [Actinotalea sp. K2]|uniref:siderophore-interacting protein n=1 Tax=Actinotalea sp. K2 TaxID=2939438 RepID=UPI0020175598|nr:siderophore-interacting protein [Actinotalea sp. K2]MCL3861027.1 siderophore-interacting protein [Actinotalea sp. K2]